MKRKILVIVWQEELKWGIGQRTQGILDALRVDYDVQVQIMPKELISAKEKLSPWTYFFKCFSIRPFWIEGVSSAARLEYCLRLKENVQKHNPCFILFLGRQNLPFISDQLRKFKIPLIYDVNDLQWIVLERKWRSYGLLSLRSKMRAAAEIIFLKCYMRQKLSLFDEVWVCSDIDADKIKKNGYRSGLRIVPNGFASFPQEKHDYNRKGKKILFLGTMGYFANRDGVSWFLKKCWGHVRNQFPDAQLILAGKWPDGVKISSEYHQIGVEIRGYVEDLATLWREADVFVCPIRIGGGTRIKILEAWAWGLPVVSTSIGIEGIKHTSGLHAIVCDDPLRLAEQLVQLLKNFELREKIGRAGQIQQRTLYDWERIGEEIRSYCAELVSGYSEKSFKTSSIS